MALASSQWRVRGSGGVDIASWVFAAFCLTASFRSMMRRERFDEALIRRGSRGINPGGNRAGTAPFRSVQDRCYQLRCGGLLHALGIVSAGYAGPGLYGGQEPHAR